MLRALANIKQSKLSPSSTANSAVAAGGYVISLNQSALQVCNQASFPSISIKSLTNLNSQLDAAKQHAKTWQSQYSKDVLNTLQTIITSGTLFTNLYNPVIQAASNLVANTGQFNDTNISNLISLLMPLQQQVASSAKSAQNVYGEITTYQQDVESDYTNFVTAYNTANAELGGTQGAIAQLQKQADAYQTAMNRDAIMIAAGAPTIIAGIALITVGAVGDLVTGGAATAAIVAGVVLVGGGVAMEAVAGKNYSESLAAYNSIQKEIANDKLELQQLSSIKGAATNLTTNLSDAEKVIGNLVTGWQELGNNFQAVISDLQNPEQWLENQQKLNPNQRVTPQIASDILCAELQTAQSDWNSAITQAQNVLHAADNVFYQSVVEKGEAPDITAAVANYNQVTGNHVVIKRAS
jgi:Bacillus haemolytic enterotoxin (HBL)